MPPGPRLIVGESRDSGQYTDRSYVSKEDTGRIASKEPGTAAEMAGE